MAQKLTYFKTSLFYAMTHTTKFEIVECLLKAGARPDLQAAFTMRTKITDMATPILQATNKNRIPALDLFFEYGYQPKRKWFTNIEVNTPGLKRARQLSSKVPTLLSLTRKTIKTHLAKVTKIPRTEQLETLDLPKSLTKYIAFY